jgi:transposase-like protein
MERTGREYPPEAVWQAQELYCVARLTFDQVAEETGVAASTLKRWSATYDWRNKRENLAQAEADLRADTIMARSVMLKKLIKSQDAQTSFAVASLESLAMKQAEAARKGKIVEALQHQTHKRFRTPEEAIAALEEAVDIKLNAALLNPEGADFKAVESVQKAYLLIEEMKAKLTPDDTSERTKGLSANLEARIREII